MVSQTANSRLSSVAHCSVEESDASFSHCERASSCHSGLVEVVSESIWKPMDI